MKYIAVCPVEPVGKQCPVALEVVENTMPEPLTWEDAKTEVIPVIIICMVGAWVWKSLRKQVWPK